MPLPDVARIVPQPLAKGDGMSPLRWIALGLGCGAILLCPGAATAQGYRIRIETRVQSAAFRGVTTDSILPSQALAGPSGGLVTPDGIAVTCLSEVCRFFRPGPIQRGGPLVTRVDLVGWGFGIPGLTVRASVRHATDLASNDVWPAVTPAVQLIEGLAEYVRGPLTVRGGRQVIDGRLGSYGLDGGSAAVRIPGTGLDMAVYGGWGLARATALPVTSDALNPLDDFQPRDRQIVAGAEVGWRPGFVDVRGEYRREVDPATDFFVSERVALSTSARPFSRLILTAGGEYDIAMGQTGSAVASATFIHDWATVTAMVRRYRPFFDLWTIWGAFSPVPYHAYSAHLTVRPLPGVTLSGRGERYAFENADAETGLTDVQDDGWRWNARATWSPTVDWDLAGGIHAELGPGASSRGFDARATRRFGPDMHLSVEGGRLERPLEFRFDEATVYWVGADAEARLADRWRFGVQVARYNEARDRPDAAAFDWNQVRLNARITVQLGSETDRAWLPPRIGRGGRR